MNNIYFTGDTHFNHENIIKLSNRPFYNLMDMEESLIENWNKVVKRSDTIYHLGDLALSWGKRHVGTIDSIMSRLNGNKILITGNHDRKEVLQNSNWQNVYNYHEIKLDLGSKHKQRIVMSHYPFQVWNQSHRGAWMLHGHCHGNLIDTGGKIMDVGVDSNNYKPLSVEQISSYMVDREIICKDHHDTD